MVRLTISHINMYGPLQFPDEALGKVKPTVTEEEI